MEPRPMTREEAEQTWANTDKAIRANGMWAKVCNGCGANVGGRLGSHPAPTEEELSKCCCPYCDTGATIRAEWVAPE